MKIKSIVPVIALGAILASCQNQQSAKQSQDSVMNADHTANAMQDTTTSAEGSPMMASMNKMMDNMHKMEPSGIADHDLAASMKEHHRGAIEMAEAELKNGSDSQLKAMAQNIKDKQGKEIADLDGLIAKHKKDPKNYDPTNADTGLGKAMSDNMMSMMEMPKEKAASDDHEFAMMMSKHHRDGIKMGNAILEFAKDPMFKSMTKKMIGDQKKEANELDAWLANHK